MISNYKNIIKITLFSFLIILFHACKKENPIQIVPEKYCWEIDNWEGLLSDSLLLTQEEPSIPNIDTLLINWLNDKNNRIDIRSLTSENVEDLKCLKQYLAGRSLVQLGESSHGTKEYNLIKTRLIKFLHEKMGFDVIAFESGFFECFYTSENINEYSSEQAINYSIFDEWWTEEVLELFEYIKQTQSTEHPLILSGFDCQTSGYNPNNRSDELFKMLSKIDSLYAEEAFTFDNYILTYRINSGYYLIAHEESITTQYLEIISFFDQHIDQLISHYPEKEYYPVFIKQSIYSTIAGIKQKIAIANNNWGEGFYIRDSAMAANVSFLKEELFPDKKIITWAHNYHIEHNIDDLIHTTNMGNWLVEKYRDDLYTIGLYMLRGKTTSGKNMEIIDVELPSTSNSLESILYHVRKKHLFIDVLNHPNNDGNRWMYNTISTKISGYSEEEMIIKNEYDGIIFIDTSSVPDYL
jgi:erythromycin esterase